MKFREDETMMEKLGRSRSQPKEPVYRTPELINSAITDWEGLDKDNKVYANGDTPYVAGTSYLQDVWDDLQIPFLETAKAQRYSDVETMLSKHFQIKNIVAHSLGGSIILE
jgi:hypothetical protein